MTNHTLEKTQWLAATSLTFGNPFKIDPIQSHTPKVLHPSSSKHSSSKASPSRRAKARASPRLVVNHCEASTLSYEIWTTHMTLHFLIYKIFLYTMDKVWNDDVFIFFCYFVTFYFIVRRRWIWTLDVFFENARKCQPFKIQDSWLLLL